MHYYILNTEVTSGHKLGYDQIVRLADQHHNEWKNEHGSETWKPGKMSMVLKHGSQK